MNNRSTTLDLMRGLSALLIVLYHFTCHYDETAAVSDDLRYDFGGGVWWGYAAVSVFFMLSGYLSGKYLVSDRTGSWSFLWHKARRLYPAYWVAMSLTWVVLFFFYKDAASDGVGWLANMTMVSRLFGVPFVDGVYWTMQCELIFCVIVALLMRIKSIKTLIAVLAAWVGVALVVSVFPDVKMLKSVKIALICDHCHDFVAGILLFLISRRGLSDALRCMSYTVLFMCVCNALSWYGLTPRTTMMVASVVLIALSARIDRYLPANNVIVKAIVWVAIISYPLYLVHEMVGFTIMRHLSTSLGTQKWLVVLPLAAVLLIAWTIHYFFERRHMAKGRR